MAASNSLAAFEDVRTLMDRAVDSPRGISIEVTTKNKAIQIRQRCYHFRRLWQKQDAHGQSIYDSLYIVFDFTKDKGVGLLKILKREPLPNRVKEL